MSYSINDFIYIQADTGDVSFTGNFLVPGTITSSNMNILNITSNNAQVIITNSGTGPALKVTQTGSEPIAEFYDDGGSIALKMADGGLIGIGTTVPRQLLDIQGGDVIVSGSIGIGTTNPITKLHIVGNLLTTGTITTSNISVIGDFVTMNTITSNTEQMVIENAGTGPALKVIQTGENSIVEFYDDGGAIALKVADGGNIGIGTMTPRKLLDVQGGDIIVSGNIGIGTTIPIHSLHVGRQAYFNGNLGIGTTVPRQLLDIQGGDAIVSGNMGIGTTLPRKLLDVQGGDIIVSGNIGIGTTTPIHSLHVGRQSYFNGNVGIGTITPRQLLDIQGGDIIATGNIGVGTTWPQQKLDVNGSVLLANNSAIKAKKNDGTVTNLLSIDSGNTVRINCPGTAIYVNPDSSAATELNYNTTAETKVWYGLTQKMMINNTGVGIGTTSPQATLHINGDTKMSGRLGTGFTTVAIAMSTKYYGPASIIGSFTNTLSTGHRAGYAEIGQDSPTAISTGAISIYRTRANPYTIGGAINIYVPPGYWCILTRDDTNVGYDGFVIQYY